MSKLSKDELIKKYSEKFSDDNDKKAEFLEDISDSFSDNSDKAKAELEKSKAELEKSKAEAEQYKTESELYKQKYIDRFMTADDKASQPKPAPVEGLQEKNIIDIKEI